MSIGVVCIVVIVMIADVIGEVALRKTFVGLTDAAIPVSVWFPTNFTVGVMLSLRPSSRVKVTLIFAKPPTVTV